MASALKEIGDKIADFVDWARQQLEDDDIRKAIAEDLGLQPGESVPKAQLPQDKLDSINSYRSHANPDKETFIILLNDLRVVYDSIKGFIAAFGVSNITLLNELTNRLFDLLAVNYFRLREPVYYALIQALGALVEDSSELDEDEDFAAWRFLKVLVKSVQFALSPFYYLYKRVSAKDEATARRISEHIFPQLASFLALGAGKISALNSIATKELIYGWDSFEDSSLLRLGIKDLSGIALRLQNDADPVAKFMLQQWPSDKKGRLVTYKPTGPVTETLQADMVDQFAQLLKNPDLFDKDRFAKVKLKERTLNFANQKPQGDDLIRLNKTLLEETYPDEISNSSLPLSDEIADRMFAFAFPLSDKPSSGSDIAGSLDISLAVIPTTHADASGLLIGVGGEGKVEIGLTDKWKFELEASANPAFSVFLDTHINNITGHGPIDAPLNVALVSIPDEADVTYAFPNSDETRIEIGQIALSFGFDGKNGGIKAQARRCAVVIATKDQDGFLAKFLPADGLRVPFDFGFGFSTEKRFFTEGNISWPTVRKSSPAKPQATPRAFLARPVALDASQPQIARVAAAAPDGSQNIPNLSGTSHPELSLQQIIPIGKSLLSATFNHLLIGLGPSSDAADARAEIEVSISLAIKIGPVTATVDRIGFEFGLAFPESGGNAGCADFSMGFKAPSGVGIKVDSPIVTGGGFLFLDREKGQYAGFVQLTLHEMVTVTAIGIITTRLPNGARGFSFVVMITVENFKPISLGLGFTLTGIGGLIAINRTCNEDFLREGIKNKTLDDLLFPKDPIRNAVQIFATLNNAFPPQEGSYLAGPVLQIRWGTPPLLTMDLGVIIEWGKRKRLIIMGRVLAIMPSEKHDLLRLQMNTVGIIDFDQNSISLDAILYDSRLVGKFPVTGSMAMRLNWGSSPLFALSIGGFHPAFKPPANFPALERLAISFSNTEDFRLRTETYIAITSNTLQFGAKIELFAKAGGFSIEGRLGYDVLIQFDPFAFIADFYASVQLKRGSHNLFKIKVEGELAGPKPLHIKGKATFEIFWCDFSVSFDKTLVAGDPPPKLAPVVVMQQLKVALNDSRNWSGQLAEGDRRMVTLREITSPDQIPLHPLGRLSVKQNVVPLGLEISRFGNTTPADARLFKINSLSVNGRPSAFEPVKDFFAPSQFLNLSDDEKLAAPSFEAMTAGITVGADSFLFTANDEDILEYDAIEYETKILDKDSPLPREAPKSSISSDFLNRHISLGAAARSDIRRTGMAKYRPQAAKNSLVKKGWTLASTADESLQGAPGLAAGDVVSYSESFQALQKLKQQNPSKAKTLMLIRVPASVK